MDQLGLESFAFLCLLLPDFVDFVLPFGDLLTDQKFYLVDLIFVGFNLGFLQGADSSVLFELFLIDANVDLELFSFIKNLVSAFAEGLQLQLECEQFGLELAVFLLVDSFFLNN